jgi:proteasome component ECM29
MAMADTANELMLLERVFLRLGLAETDDQLQNLLAKFLTPVLLKLASPEEGVRKKVMELLIHVNKRVKTRPQIQLPVEALLMQYQDPAATSFVTNFTIIYIKLGFPRLTVEKQAELVPVILNALINKPVAHLDSILLLVIPVLGKVKVPTEPDKVSTLYGLNEKPHITKHLLEMLLDMLLLPYGALSPQTPESDQQRNLNVTLPIPPCMSQNSFKRITVNNPMKPEELEEVKMNLDLQLLQKCYSVLNF